MLYFGRAQHLGPDRRVRDITLYYITIVRLNATYNAYFRDENRGKKSSTGEGCLYINNWPFVNDQERSPAPTCVPCALLYRGGDGDADCHGPRAALAMTEENGQQQRLPNLHVIARSAALWQPKSVISLLPLVPCADVAIRVSRPHRRGKLRVPCRNAAFQGRADQGGGIRPCVLVDILSISKEERIAASPAPGLVPRNDMQVG